MMTCNCVVAVAASMPFDTAYQPTRPMSALEKLSMVNESLVGSTLEAKNDLRFIE